MGDFKPTGVNPELVELVREALDAAGHERVRIVVSGGFDAAKIRQFEALGAPVDAYGVGSSLVRGAERLHRRRGACWRASHAPRPGGAINPNPRLERGRVATQPVAHACRSG